MCAEMGSNMLQKELIDKLHKNSILSADEFYKMLSEHDEEDSEYLFGLARKVRENIYGKDVYIRGLIEFSNYCRNDCYYCGIRKSNTNASRYRLSGDEILECADEGYRLGFRTFVLQGGEDMFFTAEKIADIVRNIKKRHSDCAVTLSVGERDYDTYKYWVPTLSIDPDDFILIQIYISGNKTKIFLAFVAVANINYFGRNDFTIFYNINHNREQIS